MFHSETLARVIHADRMRDLERAARDRRLLAPADEVEATRASVARPRAASAASRRGCGESARQPV